MGSLGGGGVAVDVDLPEIMLRQALAALYRISLRCLRFSSSTWECSSSWTRLSSCPLRADSAAVQDVQNTVVFHSCSSRTRW